MSRPSNVTLWDAGTYDLLSSTTCQVALNSQGGDGPTIAIAQCDHDGNFTLSNVPAGSYEISVWDQWLDQIIQAVAVSVPEGGSKLVAMGKLPVLSWFTQYDQNIFQESPTKAASLRGIYSPDSGDKGISNVTMTTRYRDGGISNQTATDSNGNGLLAELFPLFNWYVTEADTTRFKQTGVNIIVDAGGKPDTAGDGAGLWNSTYQATPLNPANCTPSGYPGPTDPGYVNLGPPCAAANTTSRVEIPGAYSYGLQGFISQRNTINWARMPYAAGENGGIQGTVVYSTTRPFDDQRYNVQTLWEPLVPRVTVNLYRKQKLADGTETLTLVDHTQTSSFDDFVNAVDANGKQTNMQCPGQRTDDPFFQYTLGGTDQFRCYDGWHNWNQVQAAPYDGRYAFPTANCAACQNNPNAGQPGSPAKILPPGDYVVEAVTPPGFEVVKEEDKNILNGDSFDAPVYTQFAGIGNVFILPDQATLNNANPYNLKTGDGVANNATSDLGVSSSLVNQPDCVGNLHRVPDFLSLFPQGGLVAPFSGMDRPLCDRKLVKLGDQMQASATFFVFTQVPAAAAGTGIILDDATSEFNAAAPDFGEKASVPFVPVSIKDFNGREIGRSYSDQWGAYNVLTPSSWLVNPPTPSGYGPNMLVTCMNDPGPIKDPVTGLMITDPQYNPAYSNFCYTLPFMPGRTTYLDTPVLPIAAFAAGYTPADCAYPDLTPTIARVDHAATAAGFGPYVASGSGPNSSLTITSQGIQNVPNPAYAGPFATVGPPSQRTLVRNYGFGDAKGTVKIGGTTIPSANVTWANGAITIVGTTANPIVSGELVVTTAGASPKSTIDAVTVTVGGSAPVRVQGSAGQTIQAAIDAAKPGDLILVDAGTYSELVVMWKPVRLQGVGANSVIINAAKYPTSKLDVWRPTINGLFGVDVTTGNLSTNGTQVDPLPGQEVTGGVVLLEPSVLGTEQGAGITVLAKGYRPDGVTPLTASNTDCSVTAPYTIALDRDNGANTVPTPHLSNFLCAASRIDGLSVTGGDAGGGIYVNGWAHNLEISNNRVYGNAGALNGGVRIGVPYLEQADFPLNAAGTAPNLVGPASNRFIEGFGYDNNVKIHHNAITKNGTVEGPAAGGGAGGGVSICSGTDGYLVDHNWVCGNFSSSDGGGVGHIGYSQSLVVGNQVVPNTISNNTILFNQSFQQSGSTHGGGIVVIGEPSIAGTLSLGTGNLTIDSNIVRGNFSEGGHGGGIRLQQVNGSDVAAFATDATRWHKVTVTNNTIDNNVAGWGGGGISLADTLNSAILNNTISSNDSTGIAGVLLTGGLPVQIPAAGVTGTTGKSHPNPAGISSDPTSTDLRNAGTNIPVISAPTLTNNIVWHNRSFYYDGTSGTATLCANNGTNTTCGLLADQATTGQCDLTNAKYWDLGILGAASVTDVSNVHPDAYAIASATQSTFGNNNPVRTVTAVLAIDSLLGNNQQVTIAGILPGTSGLIQAQINAVYHGVFAITLIDADTFSYTAKAFPAAVNISSIRKTAGLVTVTTSAPHGLVTGNQARIVVTPGNGTNNTNYGGTFIVTVLTPTTFTYTKGTNTSGPLSNNGTARLTLTDAQFGLLDFSAATATPLAIVVQPVNNLSPTYSVLSSLTGYATATNTAVDPNLKDLYCNGARVTPEFSANNPPGSVNNLQVAATTDEGNNYVNLRYGPLYLAKPASATGAPYTAFGDYHLTASSAAAINAGTPIA
ncbi:MAG: hypothetical protein WCD08_07740, partial [Steroidobacteraceae bacterium]